MTMNAWQTIDSAPKGPRRVLFGLFVRGELKWAVSGFRHPRGDLWHDGGNQSAFKEQPTHWAELPTVPEVLSNGEDDKR